MVAGGGPTPEQWKKMSKTQKTIHWICIGVIFLLIAAALIKKIFFN